MKIRRVVVCGLVVAAGCASSHSKAAEEPLPDNVLALEVENHNWSDVIIYVLHDGSRTRFVDVAATKSLTRSIPLQLIGSNGTVQLLVHRIGGHDDTFASIGGPQFARAPDDYLSPVVSVRTGVTIALTLEDNLQRSTLGVW